MHKRDKLGLEIDSLSYFRSGYYFIWLTDASVLHQSQELACQYLLQHMYVLKEDVNSQNTNGLNSLETENQRLYGYSLIGQSYLPHITFGRTNNRQALSDESQIQEACNSLKGLKGNFDRVTIYAAGENGSHSKTLYQKELASGIPT